MVYCYKSCAISNPTSCCRSSNNNTGPPEVSTHFCKLENTDLTLRFKNSKIRPAREYSFKHNQQDATLYNIHYYCQCSTCFRRFLRPSSGAQKLYTQAPFWEKLILGWVVPRAGMGILKRRISATKNS